MAVGDNAVQRRGELLVARIERAYLAVLRVALLLLATGLIVYAVWLAVTGTYHWSRDPASIKAAPVSVTAQEVAAIPAETTTTQANADDPFATEKAWYRGFADRYYKLYTTHYDRFRQPTDTPVTREQFGARLLGADRRIDAISSGSLNFADDKVRLERLLTTMTEVASLPETVNRLQRYRRAVRTKVSRVIRGSRTERYCSDYGYYIDMCISYATREIPTSRTVTESRLPDGVIEPPALFGRQQDRFLELLASRTDTNSATASAERDRLLTGNATGRARLWTSLSVVAGFFVLMFLFLLIAIERHQRRLVATPDRSDFI